MKKIKYILLAIIVFFLTYGIIDEFTFQPLGKKEFAMLFPKYSKNINRIYHKSLIGWSYKDFFDYFIFHLDSACIDNQYPMWNNEWECTSFMDKDIEEKSQWKNCPIDSIILHKYFFEFNEIIQSHTSEGDLFQKDIDNKNNYYCYLYVNSLEKYFLIYNPSANRLYYIRQKGF